MLWLVVAVVYWPIHQLVTLMTVWSNCRHGTVTCRIVCLVLQQQQQPFNGLFSRTTWVSRYQKGKTNLDFTGARDNVWCYAV